jgi:hypothetical protein
MKMARPIEEVKFDDPPSVPHPGENPDVFAITPVAHINAPCAWTPPNLQKTVRRGWRIRY